MKEYNPSNQHFTKYIFFTGKGGVGKTSIACATAVSLADAGKKILLISTDPASNLQDVFGLPLTNKATSIEEVPNLAVINLNPEEAAKEYKESVIAPFRGKLPASVLANMEEQLSGSCTVEIAAFNEFSEVITNRNKRIAYDHIIFDTAPTGHTLRMLQLPSAWSTFISENTSGASCLGQLSGLEDKRETYKQAVETLSNSDETMLVLVSRPEDTPLKEVERSAKELNDLNIKPQTLIINGVLEHPEKEDKLAEHLYNKQQMALNNRPNSLQNINTYYVPLRAYNMTGIANIRNLLHNSYAAMTSNDSEIEINSKGYHFTEMVDDLLSSGKKVIFTMGKGGVGKTSVAASIARELAKKGAKVHLTTTDPANHLIFTNTQVEGISISHIDEKAELEAYKQKVLDKARETMKDADLSYIEEDLRSPCTQEIAIFNAFAKIVARADNEIVVIDTAPTGHTLLLLDSTQSYHKEVERTQGEVSDEVRNLLPRLRNKAETEVIIVTLPETTPVFEAERLQSDLHRAGIPNKWWIINSCLLFTNTQNSFLKAKAKNEIQWIERVEKLSKSNFVVIPWKMNIE